MSSNPSPSSTPRSDGCTLAGALSVASAVVDGVTIVHGPSGCSHHHVSLLLTALLDRAGARLPVLLSDDLGEREVIFGGEDALALALDEAVARSPGSIAVLSTCVSEAIGDDCAAVAERVRSVPVVVVPAGGFLGGGFYEGERAALAAYAELSARLPAPDAGEGPVIVLVGEKNLEYEADCHAVEIGRLLGRLDLEVGLRFVREAPTASFGLLPRADLLVLREPGMGGVADRFPVRPRTPRIHGFPVGLSGTLAFLEMIGAAFDRDAAKAIEAEAEHQEAVLARFGGLSGGRISLPGAPQWAAELADTLGIVVSPLGVPVPVPEPAPVGTAGIARLLTRWGRSL